MTKEKRKLSYLLAILSLVMMTGRELLANDLGGLLSPLMHLGSLPGGNSFGPDPRDVYIANLAFAGSGCPAGSVSSLMSPDAQAFTLLFDEYIAEAGPGIPLSAGRKNCQIAVDLRFPSGYSFTIFGVDYRGYAKLDAGATGTQKTTYYFQGSSSSASLQSTYRGVMDQDYHIQDVLALSASVWSPCGATRALNMNTQVRVSTSSSRQRALLTTDSIDGNIKQSYSISWRSCR